MCDCVLLQIRQKVCVVRAGIVLDYMGSVGGSLESLYRASDIKCLDHAWIFRVCCTMIPYW